MPSGGCSSMVEQKLPKLTTRVRFPSPAPFYRPGIHRTLCFLVAPIADAIVGRFDSLHPLQIFRLRFLAEDDTWNDVSWIFGLFRRFFLSQDDTFVVVFAFVHFRVNGGEVGCFKEKEQYMNIVCGASGGVTQGPLRLQHCCRNAQPSRPAEAGEETGRGSSSVTRHLCAARHLLHFVEKG